MNFLECVVTTNFLITDLLSAEPKFIKFLLQLLMIDRRLLASGLGIFQCTVSVLACLDLVAKKVFGQDFQTPSYPEGSSKGSIHRISGDNCGVNYRRVYYTQDVEVVLQCVPNKYGIAIHISKKRGTRCSPPSKGKVLPHRSSHRSTSDATPLSVPVLNNIGGVHEAVDKNLSGEDVHDDQKRELFPTISNPDHLAIQGEHLSSGCLFLGFWTLGKLGALNNPPCGSMRAIRNASGHGCIVLFAQLLLCVNFV
ncbi:hypothetical protein PITC_037010 [Penicillium italicum]|uniref:Uncharacterized protein n=1 Tax=Penicillium italicum TaxID=40296 RepID=A0A0A2LID4_PENIT|nr:hypothetical protein PITC_037010 [Penicillium italicum]